MIDVQEYFYDLFTSDATIGLNPYNQDNEFDSYMDGDEYVLNVTDSSEQEFEDYPTAAPAYEIRIRRVR